MLCAVVALCSPTIASSCLCLITQSHRFSVIHNDVVSVIIAKTTKRKHRNEPMTENTFCNDHLDTVKLFAVVELRDNMEKKQRIGTGVNRSESNK